MWDFALKTRAEPVPRSSFVSFWTRFRISWLTVALLLSRTSNPSFCCLLFRSLRMFVFPSIVSDSSSDPKRVLGDLDSKVISLAERYVPYLQHSYECWLALGTAVDFFSYKKSGKKRWSPFYRFDWDFFSGSSPYQRRAYRHQSKCSACTSLFQLWTNGRINVFYRSFLTSGLPMWFIRKSDVGVTSFPWSIYSRVEDQSMSGLLRRSQVFSYFEKVCLAHPWLP